MSKLKVVGGKWGREIAVENMPYVCQGLGFNQFNNDWKYDIPCEISFEYDFKLTRKPVVYYYVRSDDEWFYVGYCFYHFLDWTNCPAGKLVGGQHSHDFEGALLKIKKVLPHHAFSGDRWVISVFHHSFETLSVCQRDWPAYLNIQGKGHGISPAYAPVYYPGAIISPGDFRHIPMDTWTMAYWQAVVDEFKKTGVKTPKTWQKDGLNFWDHPDKLFNLMFGE